MKKILTLLLTILIIFNFNIITKANNNKIIDEPNVLTVEEEKNINLKINNYIDLTGFDIVIYFTKNNAYFEKYNNHSTTIRNLADDIYDNGDYGVGEDSNGLILVIDIGYREYIITTCGSKCIETYTDKAIDDIYDSLENSLSNSDWNQASLTFIEKSLEIYKNYDQYHSKSKIIIQSIITALLVSLIITFVTYKKTKGQLKNTFVAANANDYLHNQKVNVISRKDLYLYKEVKKEKITNKDSTTHKSSSGVTHGGGKNKKF